MAMRFVRKVNDRGVLTLPSEVREVLGIRPGDIVELEIRQVVRRDPDKPAEEAVA